MKAQRFQIRDQSLSTRFSSAETHVSSCPFLQTALYLMLLTHSCCAILCQHSILITSCFLCRFPKPAVVVRAHADRQCSGGFGCLGRVPTAQGRLLAPSCPTPQPTRYQLHCARSFRRIFLHVLSLEMKGGLASKPRKPKPMLRGFPCDSFLWRQCIGFRIYNFVAHEH